MVKSPEEHFNSQDFSPVADAGEYTPAERLFMIKYLGVEIGKSGILEPPAPPDASDNEYAIKPNAATVITDAMLDLESGADDLKDASNTAASASEEPKPEKITEATEKHDFPNADEVKTIAVEENAPTPEPLSTSNVEPESVLPSQEYGVEPMPEMPGEMPGETLEETLADPAEQNLASDPPVRTLTAEEQARKDFADTMLKDPPLEIVLKDEDHVQMVGFYIGDQEFVVPTMAMQEVIRYEAPIRIPLAPKFVEGVISLRGRVTPVVNLRDMLMVRNTPLDGDYCIIICLRRGMQLGFLVEKIHTLYRVPQKDLEWGVESHLGINSDVDFISAIMKSEDGTRLLGMLSVDKIIEFILR